MFDGFSIKSLGRGIYKPLPNESEARDGEPTSGDAVKDIDAPSRPSFLWLYIMLSAFCGFILAIALVNLFPGNLVPTTEKTRLQKLLDLPTESVTFEPHPMFGERPTADSDMAWKALLGPSLGMIALNDSESYGLPTGGDSKIPGQRIFQVSMYHQIQCLYLIRKVYWGESSGIYNVSAEPPTALVAHTNHCFDYLLQGIKCAGDMTLEWKTDFNGNFVGWDVPHTCKSWEIAKSFMLKYRYDEAMKATDHHDHDDE